MLIFSYVPHAHFFPVCFFFLLSCSELLQHNTSTGPFQKLGRLYESCLRQSINSSFVRLKMQQIGSYMPSTVTGPSTIGGLILRLSVCRKNFIQFILTPVLFIDDVHISH